MKGKKPLKKGIRIGGKLFLILVIVFLLIRLIAMDQKQRQKSQPGGELADGNDVVVLTEELLQCGVVPVQEEQFWQGMQEMDFGVTYGSYRTLLQGLLGEEEQLDSKGKELYRALTYKGKYEDDFWLLKRDWYESYQRLLAYYGLEDSIRKQQIEILCNSEKIAGSKQIPEHTVLTKAGAVYTLADSKITLPELTAALVYLHGDKVLTLVETLPDTVTLENIWVMEMEEGKIHFFQNGFEICHSLEQMPKQWQTFREQVADMSFAGGRILELKKKTERVSGKLLTMTDTQIELEGWGRLPFAENCAGYRLYGEMKEAEKSELLLGYDYADFVLERGKICAFLITRISQPETIRVAIKNTGFASLYHEEIELEGQDGLLVFHGDYDNRQAEEIPAGQRLVFTENDDWLKEGRVEVRSRTNTGKIQVHSIARSQGIPAYRGGFEINREKEGLILVNEVPMEEYLYSVVPSEMPSSYPIEALKVQAICARTYAYRYVLHPGYAYLGAHVDDSVSYQVYNNIMEHVNSTRAVKETEGSLLCYEDTPASAYYYSTSCGFGTDAGIWDEGQAAGMPYLKSRHIADTQAVGQDEATESVSLEQEELFRAYITGMDENAYEKEEPWFRWSYEVEKLDTEMLTKRLWEQKVTGGEKITRVYDIFCTKRGAGGIVQELVLETDAGAITVDSEYKIRYILNQGGAVIRQDDSAYESSALLPSAYLIIDVVKSGGNVVGYKVIGGGFGHGVGMSQNGARAMALAGRDCEAILSFYYPGCIVGSFPG